MTTAGIASFARRMSLPMNGSSSFDYDESSANYTSGFYDDETAAASDVVADSWPDSAAQRRITLEHCQIFQFVLNSLAIGILCVFGIAGNTLSMIILQRDKHNRVAVFLLQALAVSDSSVLFIAFVVLSIFYGLLPLSGHADAVVRASPIFMQVMNRESLQVKKRGIGCSHGIRQ
jgi:hypothetical protein